MTPSERGTIRGTDPATYPTLSFAERDRRWALARRFMDEHGLDGLLFTGGGGRISHYWITNQHYLSNEPDGIVLLPRDSEPVLLLARNRWGLVHTDIRSGVMPWIADFRLGEPVVDQIGAIVRDRGLRRLGVITAGGEGPFGSLADPLWKAIEAAAGEPDAVDVARAFTIATLPRSAEELALARQAAAAAENAAAALIEVAGAGVSEVELYAASAEHLARGGVDWHVFLMVVGPEVMGYGMPRWLFPGRPPRVLEPGDVIMAEYFPTYGGIDTQLQVTVVVGEPVPEVVRLTEVARASYDAGVAALRPGVPFESVWKAMQAPIFDAGCWDADPLIHSFPLVLLGPMHVALAGRDDLDPTMTGLGPVPGMPSGGDVPIEEGMLFAVEPMTGLGRHRSMVGNLVAAGPDGGEELTTIGGEVHVVD